MMSIRRIFIFLILPWIDCSIYVYNTQDSLSVEFYDCIYHQSTFYCRRPLQPISLQRDNKTWNCSHNGILHSFSSLSMNNISVSTVLHQWKSGIDKAEEYFHYVNQSIKSNESNKYICECTDQRSFGKNCEYLLIDGTTFADTAATKLNLNSTTRMYGGDIVCYKTLECNSGLLCLDWRDICNGEQQCMFGYDEENCDKIEFNECEDDEYRCMNGMCIPDEYFLDGDYDCMDMSDEKEHFHDRDCPFQLVSFQCDDRICPPDKWSCGDGQCIAQRVAARRSWIEYIACMNRRDQFYMCEMNPKENLRTLSNGQCYEVKKSEELSAMNRSINDYCNYLIVCGFYSIVSETCPCREVDNCIELFQNSCSSLFPIQYPNGGLIAPYVFEYYNVIYDPLSISRSLTLNGTIKCRGYIGEFFYILDSYVFDINLKAIAVLLCDLYQANFSNEGYHQFCHNDSKTFDNRSYHFLDACEWSKECISAYRINDGLENCHDHYDEKQENEITSKSCSNVRRHRFRCSIEQTTCLYANALGDWNFHCENKYDESLLGTQILLSKVNCTNELKDGCQLLRRYIEASWNSSITNNSNLEDISTKRIPFRSYCDTFWDLASKEDENISMCQSSWICPQEQWQCSTGQCIDIDWVLDGEWDCPDASDEENMFAVNFNVSHGSYQQVESFEFDKKFKDKYERQPFWNICNLTIEYPCFPINMTEDSNDRKYCIDLKFIGNGQADCVGGYDERNVIDHCDRSFTALGYDFKCLSSDSCIEYSDICEERCPDIADDDIWCKNYNDTRLPQALNFQCMNGTRIWDSRCDGIYDCLHGEDEYMCDRERSSGVSYRKQKQLSIGMNIKELRLPRFPNDTNSTKVANTSNTTQSTTTFASDLVLRNSSIPDWCNRGIGILMSTNSIVCFCPPQYHGDQCQYHTDRISVYLHLDLTQSIYTTSTDKTIVIKLLVLFLFENRVLGTDEFHIRPAVEIDVYKKKKTYFHYSRSSQLLEHKQKRYFNRSNIIKEHPYSIRIEAYQMKLNEKSTRFAIWQYPLYFDFLPVYRFAKVLRLTKPNIHDKDPCTRRPCSENEECYQLLNQKSQYICLCKSNYSGTDCSDLYPMCNNNSYCSSNALCQSAYRGILNGNEFPYCICSIGYIGQRCELFHTMCSQNPCMNGGTCYQRSTPDEYICECTIEYKGTNCGQAKQSVRLYINKKNTIEYQGIVVQYFNINFDLFELNLVNQNVYFNLPDSLLYLHSGRSAPEIILLTRYFSDQSEMYIISLHMDVISIEGTTSITEKNRCVTLQSLSQLEIPIFKYHHLCRNNHNLFCFRDEKYICICDEKHIRVECFSYNNQLDRCSHCQAHGRCLKGGQNDDFICICPPCHSGKRCQFNFESFSFTLDQLFFQDLLSNNPIKRQTTFYSLIITPCLLFLLGLLNNICCFITFRRPKCLRNGIGQFLFYMTIVNQINLTILVIRLIHLAVSISNSYSYPIFDNVLCKISSYLLISSTRITYWLISLIAIERIYVVLFLNGQWLKKPYIARRFIIFIIISILTMSAYDLAFIQSEISSDDGHNAICVLNIPLDNFSWKAVHNVVTIINALIPFLVNLCCTITIICIVIKKKMNANVRQTDNPLAMATVNDSQKEDDIPMTKLTSADETSTKDCNINNNETIPESDVNISEIQLSQSNKQSRFRLLLDVLIENKELVVAPTFTLIPQLFSLPFFIASFLLRCQNVQGHHLRYLLITSYFTTFIPQLTSFFLYISPSTFYSNEWHATIISKWIKTLKQRHQPISLATKATNIKTNTK